ncbi:MAG: glycoside hydrolase [Actinobacteria bacterium]|nr:glycoside hydrolase [Actinomycetota bacterium]
MRRRPPLADPTRPWLAVAAIGAAAAVVALVVLLRAGGSDPAPRPDAVGAARSFLDGYAESDGRVSRTDQGGDTVSEGQAYGMLLAVVAHEPDTFESVWKWTRDNLRQPNGLLAWHWEDGKVASTDSAADADLDAAWALLLAAERFGRVAYRREGLELANAILEGETVSLDSRSLLVAGDWADTFPAVVDPSYFTPAAFGALGRASGDPRWKQLGETSREVLGQLTERTTGLAPDWAVVESDGTAKPTGPPGRGGEALFGYDAVRVPLWQAASCDGRDTPFAARAAGFFDGKVADEPAAIYTLEGEPRGGSPGPPLLVAAAAASAAAGEGAAAGEWLAGAEADVEAEPTYYGAALLALGRATLEPKGGLPC